MEATTINGVKFVNLTPHELTVLDNENRETKIPASGIIARAYQELDELEPIAGFAVKATSYGKTENVPDPEPGTFYVVSSLAAQGLSGREDILTPGPAIRDDEGKIIGCQGFCVI